MAAVILSLAAIIITGAGKLTPHYPERHNLPGIVLGTVSIDE